MAIVDYNLILLKLLKTPATDLFTLCNTRIYADAPGMRRELPNDEAVSFAIAPSQVHQPTPVETVIVNFQCWAEEPDSAWAVASALDTRLNQIGPTTVAISATNYRIVEAARQTITSPVVDPTTPRWFFVHCSYRVTFRTETI